MHLTFRVVMGSTEFQYAGLIIRIPARPTSQFSEDIIVAGDFPARISWFLDDLAYFRRQFWCNTFISIHKQNPIGLPFYNIESGVSLAGVFLKQMLDNFHACFLS